MSNSTGNGQIEAPSPGTERGSPPSPPPVKPLELDISQLPKPPTSEVLKNERPLPDIDIERLVKGE
jgi:hypothetical protein